MRKTIGKRLEWADIDFSSDDLHEQPIDHAHADFLHKHKMSPSCSIRDCTHVVDEFALVAEGDELHEVHQTIRVRSACYKSANQ